ncbi:MAG: 30S ribosomal protein S6 [Patescibacteria group bacterium]|nr:30S ribosomal protein S6 [Patescibacteria group bacterium]
MAKNKSSEIPHYELLYIISNKYSENELSPIIDKVRKIISDNGGNISYSEEWGKKKLAYPIKHFRYGYYNLAEFDLAGEKLVKINKALQLASEILRHQIVSKKLKTVQVIEKEKRIAKSIVAKKDEEMKEKKGKIRDQKSAELKDLDERLDKILETDDLL